MLTTSKSIATEYDDMITAGGRIQIWMGIVSAALGVIVGSLAIVYYRFFYKIEAVSAIVTSIHCNKEHKTHCTRKGEDCTSHEVHRCNVSLKGFDAPLEKVFDETTGLHEHPPQVGDTETVYFHPNDKAKTASLVPPIDINKAMAISFAIVIISAIALVILIRLRHSKTLQRLEGLSLASDLLFN